MTENKAEDAEVLAEAVPVRLGVVRRLWNNLWIRYVVLSVVAVLVMVAATLYGEREPPGVAVPKVAGHAKSPAQAAVGYMTAVARAKPSDIFAYLTEQPKSKTFMTEAVLTESMRLNPISDIEATQSPGLGADGSADVPVTYRFGDQQVHTTLSVEKCADGYWRLAAAEDHGTGFVEVALGEDAPLKRLTVGGVPVPPEATSVQLLPGTYQVGSTNRLFTSNRIELASVSRSYRASPDLTLTPDAQQEIYGAVRSVIDSCLQATTVVTPCGLDFRELKSGKDVPQGSTVRWSIRPGSADVADGTLRLHWDAHDGLCGEKPAGPSAALEIADTRGIGIYATAILDTGEPVDSWTVISGYTVDISDPDDLRVGLYYLGSTENRCAQT